MQRREFLKSTGVLATTSIFMTKTLMNCAKKSKKPNIVYILADDLGYGELGCYGQKIIKTPNIDKLAENGMKFSNHYSGSPVCAPSRCVLLTGKHSGHAYIRGNDEWKRDGNVWDFQEVEKNPKLEGQRPIPANTMTIGKLLQNQDYKTACIGKWGLGPAFSEGSPNKQGFDFFYGFNCQRQAHTYYPVHLYKNEERVQLDNKMVPPNTKFDSNLDPYDEASYADFNLQNYAPDLMIKEALNFLDENKNSNFFLYYPTPLPHVPLQVTKKWVDMYKDTFVDEEPYIKGSYFPCRYPNATYAGMISYMDDQVGQIVEKLKEMGQYENTLIIFSSDNGATYTGGADTQLFDSNGKFGAEYGKGKGFTHEGGIRVPMIASWYKKIKPGSESDHISAFWDVMATLSEVSGGITPDDTDGISFLPELLGKDQQKHEFLFWDYPEYGGQQAVRMGKWKGMRKNIRKDGNLVIELYNLDNDPKESTNIASSNPEIVEKIRKIMDKEHTQSILKSFRMKALGDEV